MSVSPEFVSPQRPNYKTCKIESLTMEGNFLLNMSTFPILLGRIQRFCLEHNIEHLAMNPPKGPVWFATFLGNAGFKCCGCWRPNINDSEFRICLTVPTPLIEQQVDSATGSSMHVSAGEPIQTMVAREESSETVSRSQENEQEEGEIIQSNSIHTMITSPVQCIDAGQAHLDSTTGPIKDDHSDQSERNATQDRLLPTRTRNEDINRVHVDRDGTKAPTKIDRPNEPKTEYTSPSIQFSALPDQEYCYHWIRTGECDFIGTAAGCKRKHEIPPAEHRQKIGWRGASKEYCTHWLKTGQCDYMGRCKHKHEIPADVETCRSIGIKPLPRWLQEQAMASPPSDQTAGRAPIHMVAGDGKGRKNKSNTPPSLLGNGRMNEALRRPSNHQPVQLQRQVIHSIGTNRKIAEIDYQLAIQQRTDSCKGKDREPGVQTIPSKRSRAPQSLDELIADHRT